MVKDRTGGDGKGERTVQTGDWKGTQNNMEENLEEKHNNTKLGLDHMEQKLHFMTEHLAIPDCVHLKGNQTEEATQAMTTGME